MRLRRTTFSLPSDEIFVDFFMQLLTTFKVIFQRIRLDHWSPMAFIENEGGSR